jgi:hypothetical protein
MGGNDYGFTLDCCRQCQTALPGQDPGIERLDSVSVDGVARIARQQPNDGLGEPRVKARC